MNIEPEADEMGTVAMWNEFIDSSYEWQLIRTVLEGKVEQLRDYLETAKTPEDIIHTQAEIYSLRVILDIPDTFINALRAKGEGDG